MQRIDQKFSEKNCVHNWIHSIAQENPDSIAAIYKGNVLKYKELDDLSNQLAHALIKKGVRKEDLIGIYMDRSLEMLVGLVGIWKAGAAYVPLDPAYPRERIALMLQNAGVKIILSQPWFEREVQQMVQGEIFCLDKSWTTIQNENKSMPENVAHPDNLCYCIYTSGSTGVPKGVMIVHSAVVNFLFSMQEELKIQKSDRILAITTLSFDIAVLELYLPLVSGAQVVIMDRETALDGIQLAREITNGITLMQATPATWKMLFAAGWKGSPGLTKILCGGESMTRDMADRLLAVCPQVFNMYGPTETTVWSTMARVEKSERSVPVGNPIANTQVYILDESMKPVFVGVPGDLYIAGKGLSRGYHKRPDLTQASFIDNPFAPGEKMYRTGDQAMFREDGQIEFLGRKDSQVKIRGFRIELGEIESVLFQENWVKDVAAVVREDKAGERRLVAYIVTKEKEVFPGTKEIRSLLKKKLPEYMLPCACMEIQELPLTPNGKIDRRLLSTDEQYRPEMPESFVAPCNEREEKLACIWSEVLEIEKISINEDFFALGGDSILSIRILARAAEKGIVLTQRDIFEHPTIKELAEIQRAFPSEASPCHLLSGMDKDIAFTGRQDIEDIYPLSPVQQGMLFHSLSHKEKGIYHEQLVCTLQGKLCIPLFQEAWQKAIQRHAVLRTGFFWENRPEPCQIVFEKAPISWQEEDYSSFSTEDQKQKISSFLEKDLDHTFDLCRPPLFRLILIRLAQEKYCFLVSYHHLILDAWAIQCLFRETLAIYQGKTSLPEVRAYKDYIAWIESQDKENAEKFWRQFLAGFQSPTPLPGNSLAISKSQTTEYQERETLLSYRETQALDSFIRQNRLTWSTLIQGAWAIVLSWYSGEKDIVFGVTSSGRPPALHGIEGMVGLFLNTLPMRIQYNPEENLVGWMKKIQAKSLAIREYELSSLVDVQGWSEIERGVPLFESIMVLENNLVDVSVSLAELKIQDVKSIGKTHYPITLAVLPIEDKMVLRLMYQKDRFSQKNIERTLSHLKNILLGFLRAKKVEEIPLLSEGEKKFFDQTNNTQSPYPDQHAVHQIIEEWAEKTPTAVALEWNKAKLTYQELNERSNQVAHHLIQLGVKAEVLVGVSLYSSFEMVIAILGILKAGGAYVPLDPQYPEKRLRYMLEDSQVKILLTQQNLPIPFVLPEIKVVYIDAHSESISQESKANPRIPVLPENLAYIIYTSGSSGNAKGVLVEHRGLCNVVMAQQKSFDLVPQSRVLQFFSLNFDAATFEILMALGSGATLCLASREPLLVGKDLLHAIQKLGITHTVLTPSVLETVPYQELPELQVLIVAGEACPSNLVARWAKGRRFFNAYGPTESTIWATLALCQQAEEMPPIGYPIANTQVYILNSYGKRVPIGVPGELCIGGVGVTRGYLNRPEWTSQKYIPDPFSHRKESKLYRTGDLARYREDGQIEYLGRMDNQVKIRGFRIELGEIEESIRESGLVQEVAVLVRDVARDKKIIAYIVPVDGKNHVQEIREYISERLPRYMLPSYFVTMQALPLTPNQKLDHKALPLPDDSTLLEQKKIVLPRTPIEEMISALWCNLLGKKTIGIEESFFDLGGHSLLATQVLSRICDTFQVQIAIHNLFDCPTIESLAKAIEGLLASEENRYRSIPLLRISRQKEIPLSFAQQRLWFLDKMDPGIAAYNIPAFVALEGEISIEILEKSIQEIIRRHEALRTIFLEEEGNPRQAILPYRPFALEVVNLKHINPQEREKSILERALEEARNPFDLATYPLFRIILWKIGEQNYRLLINIHHIISDGWSISIFLRELASLYHAFSQGKPCPLPEPVVQYADFSASQRNFLQGEKLASQLAYWKKTLGVNPAVLQLPLDKPRPASQTFQGENHSFTLPLSLSQSLISWSKSQGVTLFMTLLAAFQTLLYRYSGQKQICVGTPIANRNRMEIEGVMGFFVNTLVLDSDFSSDPTFLELLCQIKEKALGAYAHQDVPFEKVVEALQPGRDLSYTPLFQVMFALQNIPPLSQKAGSIEIRLLPFHNQTAKFDLTLFMEETQDGIKGIWEYNTDLWERSTLEKMAFHFQTLLESIIKDPGTKAGKLCLLAEQEKKSILYDFNKTQRQYPQGECIHDLVLRQIQKTPDATAIVWGTKRITYRELDILSRNLAHYLQSMGVGPEIPVGICLERSVSLLIGILAVLRAGGAYIPLDPVYPKERLSFMLQDTQAKVLLTQKNLVETLADYAGEIVFLDHGWESQIPSREEELVSNTKAENLAYFIYTSGSTGRPKGVAIEHRATVNFLYWAKEVFSQEELAGTLFSTSVCFDLSIFEIFLPWITGNKIILAENALHLPGLPCTHEVTLINTVPSAMAELIRMDALPTSIQTVNLAGEPFQNILAQQIYARKHVRKLYNLYGPSETTTYSSFALISRNIEEIPPIGIPIANTQIYLLDSYLEPVPVGVVGEIYIGGDGVAREYFGRKELTQERFIPDPFHPEKARRMYKTGDLAQYRKDGQIHFLGRIDHQIKIRGFRIEMGEIETVLSQHSLIQEVVVIVREDNPGSKRIVAYLSAREKVEAKELRSFLQQKLPDYMIPSHFVFLEALPRTPNGKVDRKALPTPEEQGKEAKKILLPQTQVERELLGIFQEVLRLQEISMDDNFFELGGDSILSMQIIARANQKGIRLTPRQIFRSQTIALLAQEMQTQQVASTDQAISTGNFPLTPIQHWFFEQNLEELHHWNQAIVLDLRKRIDPQFLESAIKAIVQHHDGLRLRFELKNGQWEQKIVLDSDSCTLRLFPLLEQEQRYNILSELQGSLNLQNGPVGYAVLFDPGNGFPQKLYMFLHHLVIDGVSWRILLEDIETAYFQITQGKEPSLPPKTTSLSYWAKQLMEYAKTQSIQEESRHWLSHASSFAPLPIDHTGQNTEGSTHILETILSQQETLALLQEIPKYQIPLHEMLIAVLAQSLFLWTGHENILMDIEGHGREEIFSSINLSRTTGWFTTIYPIHLKFSTNMDIQEKLHHVHTTLASIPHHGLGYGVLRYLCADKSIQERFSQLPQPQIVFNYLGQFDPLFQSSELFQLSYHDETGPSHSPKALRRHLLDIDALIINQKLHIKWHYSQNLYNSTTIANLVANFEKELKNWIQNAPAILQESPKKIPISDVSLSKESLADILSEIEFDE
ncbi:MAG: amino acid adenylation domain-containing protein [Candidatus Brocadiae bacterium]|nr:amino acid adenylation domain-containing protein [Candidatus Brocadiia bacterium]